MRYLDIARIDGIRFRRVKGEGKAGNSPGRNPALPPNGRPHAVNQPSSSLTADEAIHSPEMVRSWPDLSEMRNILSIHLADSVTVG
jgi:hypothetical protein